MWHDMFQMGTSFGEKTLRCVLVYLFLVFALRIFGKRELGQANALDLVVLLLIANAVQNGIIGNDISVTGAAVGALVLLSINRFFAEAAFRSPAAGRVLDGQATTLIADGKLDRRAMHKELVSLPELRDIAKRQGFPDLGEVQMARLETNGVISMFGKGEPEKYHPAVG